MWPGNNLPYSVLYVAAVTVNIYLHQSCMSDRRRDILVCESSLDIFKLALVTGIIVSW